jgi:hypothetical protein
MSFTQPGLDLYVRDFSAGYLDTPEPDVLPPGATPDAANTLFSRILAAGEASRVSIKKRDGHKLVTPSAMALGQPVDGMTMYQRAGSANVLLAGCGGTLYQWNNVDTMSSVVSGFTGGKPMRFVFMRGHVIVTDGTFMRRIDSTLTAYPIGQAAPTGAPGLAVAAGPGVTGTYEGFAVWYDPLTDHESSPSLTSGAVVFANQQRQWTKPVGSPGAAYTKWRVYVRRTDTNESNFFRAGTFDTSAGTGTEATSDAARRNIGPNPGVNDPPPGPFAILAVWRSYMIGVLPNGTDLYFSKLNDFESWNPNDVFKVAGGKESIHSVQVLGENIIIQTGSQSFTLEGDRVPFRVVDLHINSGNVSQESTLVVDAEGLGTRMYGFDEQKGPTASDGRSWANLADDRVNFILRQVNRSQLVKIRMGHSPSRHLVWWALPFGTSSRLRTLLPYDYKLDKWLPPMDGLEYASFTTFINTQSGTMAPFLGDAWGRLYEMFGQSNDGVPVGFTTVATVTSATASTVSASGATFYTAGHGMVGLAVAVVSPSGAWQFRRVQSNTATAITLDTTNDTTWQNIPQAGWTVLVGGIRWYWTTPWQDYGRPDKLKRGAYFTLTGKATSDTHLVQVGARLNGDPGYTGSRAFHFLGGGQVAVWGSAIWGVSLWGAGSGNAESRKQRVNRSFYSVQFQFQNYYPNQAVEITGYGLDGDLLRRRRVGGL